MAGVNECCGQPMEYALLGNATLYICQWKGFSHGHVSINGRAIDFDDLTWYVDEEDDNE